MGFRSKDKTIKNKLTLVGRIKLALLLVMLLAVGTAAVIFYLARSEPAYYTEYQQFIESTSPEQLQQLAEQVDWKLQALADLAIKQAKHDAAVTDDDKDPRPEDVKINQDQTLTLSNEQLAAVVQTHMDDWMKSRGFDMPDEVIDPMVAVDNGQLVMAFRLESGAISLVVSGRFSLDIQDDGYAILTLDRFLVGQLPVPARSLSEHLYDLTGDRRLEQAGEWLSKLEYMEIKPVLELDHRRRARVMDYLVHEDELVLTLRIQDHKTYKAMNAALAGVPTP